MLVTIVPSGTIEQLSGSMFNWLLCFSVAVPLPAIVISYTRLLTHKKDEIKRLLTGERETGYVRAFGYTFDREDDDPPPMPKGMPRPPRGPKEDERRQADRRKGQRRDAQFQSIFRAYYNWYAYVLGLALLAVVSVSFAIAALASAHFSLFPLPADVQGLLADVPPRALAAAAGAYLFGVSDAIRRYRTVDLYPSVLHFLWVRILVASFVGFVIGAPLKEPADLLAAFAVGVFPLSDMWAWLRTKVDIQANRDPVDPPMLHLIQGMTDDARTRLNDEGITSVAHLAYADPVGLLFRTNLEWNVILDLIDQAILVNYVGESITKLRPLGIRTAVEFATIDERLHGDDEEESAIAAQLVKTVAAGLGQPEDAVRNISFQLNNDQIVLFIWEHWNAATQVRDGEIAVGMVAGPPEEAGVAQIAAAPDVPVPT
jgi:hypothetical protein